MTFLNDSVYTDRLQAGEVLAEALRQYTHSNGVVLAVPRGGIPVACVVARELGLPLDLLLTKKIGHPTNKEYAIGAVSLDEVYVTQDMDIPKAYIEREGEKIRERLREMYKAFVDEKKPQDIEGKVVIIVDDGIATGRTLISTIPMLRRHKPAKLIVAVPVSSRQAFVKLSELVDEMVCPLVPQEFWGVGAFYEDFRQVSDEDAIYYLRKLEEETNAG